MRYIHPVGIHEKFVASGEYDQHYSLWCVHQLPDGAWMMRVDWDRRNIDGTSILIEAWRSPIAEGSRIDRFDVWGFADKRHPIQQVKARYFMMNDTLEISLQLNNQPQHTQSHHVSSDTRLLPDMPLFWGYMTTKSAQTIVSCLFDFASPQAFLPVMTQPIVAHLGEATLTIAQKAYLTQHYQLDNRQIWVDNLGIVLAYQQDDIRHVVKNYARRKYIHERMV